MIVHHVEVDQVGASGDHRAHFLAEPGEIGGENRRCDLDLAHGVIIAQGKDLKSTPMGESSKYEITVEPRATYVEDQSDPSKNQYVFAYTISVTNTGTVPAQLISRHWVITDANNKVMEVKGLGVIGQQPLLKPGESFEYTSGTHLETAVGTMHGTYQMVAEDGQHFDAPIPSFTLSVPRILH
jgi:ApaG protein